MSIIKKKKMRTGVILLLVFIIVGTLIMTGAMKPADVEVSRQNGNIINKLALEPGFKDYAIAVDQEVPNSTIVGDVNLDGYVTSYDAFLIGASIVNNKLAQQQKINADVNGDGKIGTDDQSCILKYISGSTTDIGNITVPFYNIFQKGQTIKLKVYDTTEQKEGVQVKESVNWQVDENSKATVTNEQSGSCTIKLNETGEIKVKVYSLDSKYDYFYIKSIEPSSSSSSSLSIAGENNSKEDSNIIGDVNLDGYVTSYDAACILAHIIEPLENEQAKKNAKVNDDDQIGTDDASCIYNYICGNTTDIGRITVPLYNKISKDETINLKAYDKEGETSGVTWSSTNSKVAEVNNGEVTIKGLGHAIIMAKKGECCDIFRIEGVEQETAIQLSYEPTVLNSLPKDKNNANWSNSTYIYIYDNDEQYEEGYEYKITEYDGNEDDGTIDTETWNEVEEASSSFGDFYRIEFPKHDDAYINGVYGIQVRRKNLEATESETYYYKLDTKAPVISEISWETTSNSITVELKENDSLSGIKTNKIILGKGDESNYINTYEDKLNICEFTGLTPDGFYCLSEVKVTDNAGNSYKISSSDYSKLGIYSLDIYTRPEAPEVCKDVNGTTKLSKTSVNDISTDDEQAILYFTGGVENGNYYKVEYAGESNTGSYTQAPENIIYIDRETGTHTLKVKATGNGGDSEESTYQIKFEDVEPDPQVTVALNKTNITLKEGDTQKLVATVNPSSSTVVWSSDKTDIATVDQTGNVKAVAKGTAIITAAVGDVKATCTVTVTEEDPDVEYVPLDSIKLNISSLSLKVGETNNLQLTLTPATADIETVTWESSKESVATVDDNGKITAEGEGTATITVTVTDKSGNTKTATVNVTVTKENNNGGNGSGGTGNGSGNNGGQTNGSGNNGGSSSGGSNGGSTLGDVLGSGAKNDPTLAEKVIPKTGFTHIFLIAAGVIAAGGVFAFIRYKKILK